MIKLFGKVKKHGERVALIHGKKQYSFLELDKCSDHIASLLLETLEDLKESRVAFLVPPSFEYICILWGIWKAGGIAVPLSLSAKKDELDHILTDAEVEILICNSSEVEKISNVSQRMNIKIIESNNSYKKITNKLPRLSLERRAMILYTSGTTNQPKGVVSTHENIQSQITTLVIAWDWVKEDFIPLILPLNHIHGLINSLCCPLWVGAKVEILGSFESQKVINAVSKNSYTVFTAVPTMYFSLIDELESMSESSSQIALAGFKKMRLMMSGSAALNSEVHKKWTSLTNHILLERYGMTEIGMALSNPLKGERKPGYVGKPLPGMKVALINDKGNIINKENEPGEIICKGPQVLKEYWKRPKTTKDSFHKGWFKTGDVAVLEGNYYKILGRKSVDIIKSGGYKLSALEIEDFLVKHPKIKECSVVGLNDKKWGEAVAVAIVINNQKKITLEELTIWARENISNYKIPRILKIVDSLPKNSMGKINKTKVKEILQN